MTPAWLTAFLDFTPEHFEDGLAFWSRVTAYAVSPRRGDAGEFATLLPDEGDAFLRAQRLDRGPDRVHLDLHVAHPRAAADRAVRLGATEVDDLGYVVLRSPGGLDLCFVPHPGSRRPPVDTWPDGHRSLLDQVCLDIPADRFDDECRFWSELTGWELGGFADHLEFRHLVRPPGQPLRILLQRLDEPTGAVRAHLDWATTDRRAETARHEALGARVLDRRAVWTVLADPVGRRYCITDRDPGSGRGA